ncbi:Zn-finger protein [Desulfobaculum xiamenense]|uniref:Zn-finger protein n=1 Tax=Desulfobaculum xiamenense TaxID=995050 RepID=A0A846QTG9_9BACT|nr:cysteine-rich small domain-containing protein [Desulfobaculum xiamenense]NJB68474.1 Zn-finger protein [Desulfobaculum xiamenense]
MKHSYRFFRNTDCAYFPCHAKADPDSFNCLFCFCPLYFLEDCGGNPTDLHGIKDCSNCTLPHSPNGYDHIIARLKVEFDRRRRTGDND